MGLRFGIIGCGDIAEKSFAPSLLKSDLAELTAVCRRDLEKAREFAAKFGDVGAYPSAEEVVADPNVDAVILATPPNVHLEQTEMAANAGKHVLSEKPMALDADNCRGMIEACREANVKLGTAYRRRLFPQVLEAKRQIEKGSIGKVVCVRTHYSGLSEMDQNWRSDPEISGGGMMMDMAVHRLEVLLNFSGRPVEVQAMVDTVHHDWPVDDTCALLIRCDDGMIAVHSTIGTSPPRHDFAQIDGTKGRILVDPLEFGTEFIDLEVPEGSIRVTVDPLADPYYDLPMIDDFVKAVRQDREPVCDGPSGYWTQAVVDAAYESSREKRAVEVIPLDPAA